MAILYATPATFTTVYSGAAAGDTIRIDGASKIVLGNSWIWDKAVTIEPGNLVGAYTPTLESNPLGVSSGDGTWDACFTPLAWFEGLTELRVTSNPGGYTFTVRGGIKWTYDPATWPNWTGAGQTWTTLGLAQRALFWVGSGNGNIAPFTLDQVFFFGGNPDGTQFADTKLACFSSPTTYYPAVGATLSTYGGVFSATSGGNFSSVAMAAGWGDTDLSGVSYSGLSGYLYNPYADSPSAIRVAGNFAGATIRRCRFDSTLYGIVIPQSASTSALIELNLFERSYTDAIQLNYVADGPNQSTIVRNNLWDMHCIGDGRDLGNPHPDGLQATSGVASLAVRGFQLYNNVQIMNPSSRVQSEGFFLLTRGEMVGPIICNNISIGPNKFIQGWMRDPYITGNVGFVPSCYGSQFGTAASIIIYGAASGSSNGYIANNVGEGVTITGTDYSTGNTSLTYKNAASQAAMLVGDWTVQQTSLSDAFEKAKLDSGSSWGTIKEFLTSSPTGPVWCQSRYYLSQATSTAVTSDAVILHDLSKAIGASADVVVPSGLDARVVQIDEATPGGAATAGSWTVGPGTLAATVGKRVQFRMTTAATNSTPKTFAYTASGSSFTWRTSTVSLNVFPRSTFSASHHNAKATNNLADGAGSIQNSPYMILAFKIRPDSITSRTARLLIEGGGNSIMVSQINGTISLNLRNGSGGGLSVTSTAFLTTGADYNIVIAIDLTKGIDPLDGSGSSTFADGFRMYVNGARYTGFSATTWNANVMPTVTIGGVPYPALRWLSGTTYHMFTDIAGTLPFLGDFEYLYLNAKEWVNIEDPDVMARFSVDYIGDDGSGITGRQPEIFVIGRDTELNSAVSCNRGQGGAFPLVGGSNNVTSAVAGVTPGDNLTLISSFASAATPRIGTAINVTVQSMGYNKALNLTGVAGGAAGTWATSPKSFARGGLADGGTMTFTPSATGALTLDFTDDASYTDPSQLSTTVLDAATVARYTGLSLGLRLGL